RWTSLVAFRPAVGRRAYGARRPFLSLQVSVLGAAGLVEELDGRRRSEIARVLPLAQPPHDLLVGRDLEDLHDVRPLALVADEAAPVADQGVAVREAAHLLDDIEGIAGEIVLVDLPHDLALGIHLAHVAVLVAPDEG